MNHDGFGRSCPPYGRTTPPKGALILRFVAALVLITGLAVTTHADRVAADPLAMRLHTEGRWLVDSANRVVLLHGVNNVDKDAPFVTLNDGFTLNAQDAALLAGHGFNTVRLGVEFAGLMPQRGQVDTAYLNRVKTVVDVLGAQGIRVLIDNHQDSMSDVFLGNGFPAWAVTRKPFPHEPNVGWPLNSATMLSLNISWTNFWNNKAGVVDELGRAFTALATKLHGDPAVLGYEVMNEPWPGLETPTCLPLGCPLFDRKYQKVHQKLTEYLHAGDPGALVFWEPHTLWNTIIRTHIDEPPLTPKITDKSIVFSFHDYCGFSELSIYFGAPAALKTACNLQHNITYSNYDIFQKRAKMPALLTEFGGTSDPEVVARTMPHVDQRFVGWQYWHYASVFPPSGPPRPDPFAGDLGRQLVRTYPRATAGLPTAMTYNATDGAFSYSYVPRPSSAPTEIYVSDLQYPSGYRVALTGACALSSPGDRLLLLQTQPGAHNVNVSVTAGAGAWPAC